MIRIRRLALPLLAAIPLIVGARAGIGGGDTEQRLGSRFTEISQQEARQAGNGAGLFAFPWPPVDRTNLFNAKACSTCHQDPTLGGTTRDPEFNVHMVPSAKDPSGWEVFQLKQEVKRQVTRRDLPPETEVRRSIALYGIGLLEAIPDSRLVALADPDDKDGDGISGRFLRIDGKIGRFGWKAAVPDLDAFTRQAFVNELGVTVHGPGVDDAQMDENQLEAVANYMRLLVPPSARDTQEPEVIRGRALFEKTGCAKCHVPSHKTGPSPFAVLANKTIEPYTDLLLHDVGPGKAIAEKGKQASRREFRTPPLWGVGRIGGPFWHDGSAPDLDAAIRKHEGEAIKIRDAYSELAEADRKAILRFLESL